MATIAPRLQTKLSTKLALTPEVKTALELLQLPQIELEARIEQEIQENPLLEWEESLEPTLREIAAERGRIEGTDFARSTDLPDYDPLERLVASKPGLYGHLEWQAEVAPWPEDEKLVALELIPRIAPDGYLREADEELAAELGIDTELVARARERLQLLDPTGVAARDACECLLLQLDEQGEEDCLAAAMLRECHDELEAGDLDAIAAKLDADLDEIAAALAHLRTLNPDPGGAFRDDTSDPIQPEVVVEPKAGGYKVEPYQPYTRRVRRSEVMLRFQHDPESFSQEERRFLKDKMRSAEYFLGSLKQRELTLLRVTEAIVRHQAPMLEQGEGAARPLTLKDIAAEVDLHESTISRVTRRKYAITPNGIMELKAFFRQSVDGEHTPYAIKEKIRGYINEESPKKPYSDQALADLLTREGIDVARRTVAKYRTELDIPTRSERKRTYAQP